jgi:hypothetical protein
MTDWSWKQAVADSVLGLVNDRSRPDFSIDDMYSREEQFSQLFPSNRHVKEKIRQTLQRLRDDGFLTFLGAGKYQVNLGFPDLIGEPEPLHHPGFELPATRTVVHRLRLRCTLLASEIKQRYNCTCQLCRMPVVLSNKLFYAEAHHLRPLGAPHLGPDIPGNIVVLCPNHHIMFDRGVVKISLDDYSVRHLVPDVFAAGTRLHVATWHGIDAQCLEYYNKHVVRSN